MKIVCCVCKKVIGEKMPFRDSSELRATCTPCLEKAREKAAEYRPESDLTDGKEIVLENGLKGTLWIAKNKKEKLFLGEMAVSGKRFFCFKSEQTKFQDYLKKLTTEEVDVTLLHSIVCKLDTTPKGRKKQENQHKVEEPKKDDSIHYNCTIKAPKHYVQLMYDDMAGRMDMVNKIFAAAAIETYNKNRRKTSENNELLPLSESKQTDNSNPESRS